MATSQRLIKIQKPAAKLNEEISPSAIKILEEYLDFRRDLIVQGIFTRPETAFRLELINNPPSKMHNTI
ncbi:unnamed protein product [Acidithrix sp. C25]|nr:unnamed protein product [Acidithrix sp. C25]